MIESVIAMRFMMASGWSASIGADAIGTARSSACTHLLLLGWSGGRTEGRMRLARATLQHDGREVPAFGVRSAIARDNLYWFGTRGLVFTSPWGCTPDTERQAAVILLSASGRPIELEVRGTVLRHRAFAIAPLTRCGLCAIDA